MIYYILLFFMSLLSFHITTRYNRRGRLLQKIPGPTPYPLVGNLLKFNVNCLHKFWNVAREITKTYYPITRFWLCATAVISVRHPDDLEIIFTSQKLIDKGYIYDYLHPWLKTGLLTSTGKKWHQRRKILTPAFHFNTLKQHMEIINKESKKVLHVLKSEKDEMMINLIPFCSKYTLNIVCESVMGIALDKMDDKKVRKYMAAVHNMGNVVLYRIPRPYIKNWMMKFVWKMGSLQRNATKTLHQFTANIIKDRREYHQQTNNQYLTEYNNSKNLTSSYDTDDGRKRKLNMLDLLLVAQQNGLIDNQGIQEEVDTFIFEAHDTTGMALTFLLMLLAENKEAQSLARDEVTEILNENEGELGVTNLQELFYLDRCIKESFRLFPPVATLLRYTSKELQLKNALVPADSHIMIHLYDTHRDPNFWPQPDKFDPDRFLIEHTRERHPFCYVPFSAGSRNCIGQKLAVLELKSLVARILYDFYLEPIDSTANMKLIADILLRPLHPVNIKFIRINKKSL